ncbi:CBS domain-containing protein [Blastopirellula sp. JC732]|uniref:CBS domain-containing protein n=1 Tax=Blastopirellula sediminis TaxID=2894196 RepID=A0A9X1MJV1_9BACT|nr:CBS domain-containing protein [Blastopirellula sediminis]MCC9609119.1 CBS domain-containing protein [Blastopirellula sediminis]MCC9628104.1 CBS domain-containing protein [Blastopirellula sediminis]
MTEFQLHLTTEPVTRLHPDAPLKVDESETVASVMRQMRDHKVGAVLVTSANRMTGIFTERDALHLMAQQLELNEPISRRMKRSVVLARRDDNVATAIKKMAAGGHRRLPLVDANGNAVGVITAAGVLHFLAEHFPEAIYNLPPTQRSSAEREGA